LIEGFEVPGSGDDVEAVVDCVAAAAALPQYLGVLEPGDDVLDAGSDAAACPVVVVAADGPGVVTSRGGDRCDGPVSAVAEDDTTIEQMRHGVTGHDDIIAVSGPALAGLRHAAPVRADDDLGVEAAAVVVADGGDRLAVHRDQGGVDDPRVVAGVGGGSQCVGQHRHQVMDDPVHRRLAGGERAASPRVVRFVRR